MPKASPIRSSFNAGELSPLVEGRVDVAKYSNGCHEMVNFIPAVQGPAVRRAGTRYVAELKSSSNRAWLAKFEFNTTQAYILEFGNYYLRFYTQHGQLLTSGVAAYKASTTVTISIASPGVITWTAHGLSNGDTVTFTTTGALPTGLTAGTTYYVINAATDTFQVASTSGGTAINTSGTQSGTHTGHRVYLLGDLVTSSGVTYYCIATTYGNAPPNATYWYALAGSVYEIPTPYSAADLTDATDATFKLDMVQSGDVIYIAHPSYPTQKLSRYGNTKWTLAAAPFTNGPFKTQNSTRTQTMYASATSGTITLTSNTAMFSASMVGAFVYLEPADLSAIKPWTAGQEYAVNPYGNYRRSDGKTYMCTTNGIPSAGKVWRTGPDKPIHIYGTQADGDYNGVSGTTCERQGLDWQFVDSGYGYVKITGYTSPTQVTAVVQGDNPLPSGVVGSGNATFRWALGAFSGAEGYPSKICFFRERLTLAKGQDLFFSCAGDFENFASKDDSGQIVADRAIRVTISSDQVNQVQWMVPTQALLIGTSGAEFACSENTTNEAFAPGNVKIEQQTSEGSRAVAPVRVGYSTLFVQRSGRKVKEAAYNFQQNGYVTNDLTVLSEHVTFSGIVQTTWHKEPYVCMWAARTDGELLGFTFNKEQDVLGWHPHVLGGSFASGNAVVESVCTIPGPNRDRDELWLIVKRTINGSTKRYVEYLEREYQDGDLQSSCFYVDCGATYSGSPATTISGLGYLEGQEVQVLVDGAAHPNRTVSGGAITLQIAGSVVNVGLPCPAMLQTTRIEAGAGDGTAQGKTKRINKVVIRFYNTLGAKAGPDENNLDQIEFRAGSDLMNQAPPLFTGDKLIEWPGSYDFDGYVTVKQDQPLPMTVVAVMPQLHTFDR